MQIVLICLLSLIYVFVDSPIAQGRDTKDKLSLHECIRISLTNSLDVKIGEEKEREAQEWTNEYRAAYWPKISLLAECPLDEKSMDYSYSSNINAKWEIFNKGRRSFAIEKTEKEYLSSQWQRRFIRQDMIHNTISAYVQRDQCEEICLLAKDVLAEEERRLKIVKARSEEGFVPEIDVVSVEAEIRQAQIALSKAISELKISGFSLNHAMGIDINSTIEIEDIDYFWWNALIEEYKDIKDCFKMTFLNRLDYKIAECNLKAKKANLKKACAEAWPKLFLETKYYPPIQSTKEPDNFTVGLTLDIPLFEGGLKKSQIKRAKVQVRIAQLEIQRLKKRIYKQVVDVHEKLRDLQIELCLQKEKLFFISKNLKAQKSLYNASMSDINKLNDAHHDYTVCRLKINQLKGDILLSFLLLLREIGKAEVFAGDLAVTKPD